MFGEGPLDATIMFVGEQPGDQEDLAGRPFVGPAGQLFDAALDKAGIDRSTVYVTNAVKHFKFVQRGKRRIHSKPDAGEIAACRWWIDQERELIRHRSPSLWARRPRRVAVRQDHDDRQECAVRRCSLPTAVNAGSRSTRASFSESPRRTGARSKALSSAT